MRQPGQRPDSVLPRFVAVRDTEDNGTGPVLIFTAAERDAFLGGTKDREFDL